VDHTVSSDLKLSYSAEQFLSSVNGGSVDDIAAGIQLVGGTLFIDNVQLCLFSYGDHNYFRFRAERGALGSVHHFAQDDLDDLGLYFFVDDTSEDYPLEHVVENHLRDHVT
jgi:hypothetical protein